VVPFKFVAPICVSEEAYTQGKEAYTQGKEAYTQGKEAYTQGKEACRQGQEVCTEAKKAYTSGVRYSWSSWHMSMPILLESVTPGVRV